MNIKRVFESARGNKLQKLDNLFSVLQFSCVITDIHAHSLNSSCLFMLLPSTSLLTLIKLGIFAWLDRLVDLKIEADDKIIKHCPL